jgi:hypothetical protein
VPESFGKSAAWPARNGNDRRELHPGGAIFLASRRASLAGRKVPSLAGDQAATMRKAAFCMGHLVSHMKGRRRSHCRRTMRIFLLRLQMLARFANRGYGSGVSLKPQDLVVLLKLALHEDRAWTFPLLAAELSMSASEVHNAVARARKATLLDKGWRPNRSALIEFLVHGVRYAFAPQRGGITRGVPTAHGAAPLVDELLADGELPPVWPDAGGKVRGEALSPLYKTVPEAALRDPRLHECLALLDAVRCGRARERTLAAKYLTERLKGHGREAATSDRRWCFSVVRRRACSSPTLRRSPSVRRAT